MVMDQFVTTYRKEYLWPYVQTIGLKPEPEKLYQPQHIAPKDLCECHKLPKPRETNAQRVLFGPDALKEESWSRLGPMGPLLDPKIYPARVSDVPQTHIGRYNQPNVFMQKLQEKYPFIYECLRTAPPDDLISRIHRDRLRSTYMVDFCKLKKSPQYPDHFVRKNTFPKLLKCPIASFERKCRPGLDPRSYRTSEISNRVGGGKAVSGQKRSDIKCENFKCTKIRRK